jgi:lipopolysaccharide biosynthesis glycosyltransferase
MEKSVNFGFDRQVAHLAASSRLRCGSYPIVMACDEAYAMPLAVAIRSIAEANRSRECVDVVVLSNDFSQEMKRQVEASAPSDVVIHWVFVDLCQFDQCSGILTHTSKMVYARLLLPYLLPSNVVRALYLDADILIVDDLDSLWGMDLEGYALGAVPDLDAADNAERLSLSAEECGNQSGFGSRLGHSYFNAGVLLVDLPKWRQEEISERAIGYLTDYPHAPYADQDALNVACAGRWKRLDNRWNLQGPEHGQDPVRLNDIRPAILHFCCKAKPWNASSLNSSEKFYDKYRSRTKFARTPKDKVRDIVLHGWASLRRNLRRYKLLYRVYRRLKNAPAISGV